jgi:hypothetical protein
VYFTVKFWGSSCSQFCCQFLLFCEFDEMGCRSWVWCCLFHFLVVIIKCLICLRSCKFGNLQHLRPKFWEQHFRPKLAVLAVPKPFVFCFKWKSKAFEATQGWEGVRRGMLLIIVSISYSIQPYLNINSLAWNVLYLIFVALVLLILIVVDFVVDDTLLKYLQLYDSY